MMDIIIINPIQYCSYEQPQIPFEDCELKKVKKSQNPKSVFQGIRVACCFQGNPKEKREGLQERGRESTEKDGGEWRGGKREEENLERIERGKERDWIEIESRERDRGSENFFSCLRASRFEVGVFTFVCLVF